jgi:predicted O-methyltransferase YrrM
MRQIRAVAAVNGDERRLEDLVWRLPHGFHGLIHAMQVPTEILELLRQISALRARHIMEIGTARGGTLFALTRVAAPDAHLISLDLPGGTWGGGYPWWKVRLYRSLALSGQRIDLIRADSHSAASLDAVQQALGTQKLDVLFIDGDHTYAGAKQDFEQYGPLVRQGGIIAFHDIADHPSGRGGDVPKLWRELQTGRSTRELIADRTKGYGIGVIYV